MLFFVLFCISLQSTLECFNVCSRTQWFTTFHHLSNLPQCLTNTPLCLNFTPRCQTLARGLEQHSRSSFSTLTFMPYSLLLFFIVYYSSASSCINTPKVLTHKHARTACCCYVGFSVIVVGEEGGPGMGGDLMGLKRDALIFCGISLNKLLERRTEFNSRCFGYFVLPSNSNSKKENGKKKRSETFQR